MLLNKGFKILLGYIGYLENMYLYKNKNITLLLGYCLIILK